MAWAEAKADQGARVRNFFRLPPVITLVVPHSFFAGLIPRSARLAGQVVFANESSLDGLGALGIDFLLTAGSRGFLPVR